MLKENGNGSQVAGQSFPGTPNSAAKISAKCAAGEIHVGPALLRGVEFKPAPLVPPAAALKRSRREQREPQTGRLVRQTEFILVSPARIPNDTRSGVFARRVLFFVQAFSCFWRGDVSLVSFPCDERGAAAACMRQLNGDFGPCSDSNQYVDPNKRFH